MKICLSYTFEKEGKEERVDADIYDGEFDLQKVIHFSNRMLSATIFSYLGIRIWVVLNFETEIERAEACLCSLCSFTNYEWEEKYNKKHPCYVGVES